MREDWDAGVYHRISEPQLRWGREVLSRLTLRGDETVLDAGCGSGRLTAELAARVPRGAVLAVDNSEAMLREAAHNLAAVSPARVTVERADLASLRYDAVADVVFSAATFHWVLDHDALFAGLWRALRPGGVLEAQCGGEGNLARTLTRAMTWVADQGASLGPQGAYPAYFADAPHTEARLRAAGFTDLRVWLSDAPTPFATRADYRLFVEKVVLAKLLPRLPTPELREALLDHVSDLAEADAQPYALDYVRLNLHARRAGQPGL